MTPHFRPPVIYPAFLRHPSGLKTSPCDARFREEQSASKPQYTEGGASDVEFTAVLP
jgi:hypothetical protein